MYPLKNNCFIPINSELTKFLTWRIEILFTIYFDIYLIIKSKQFWSLIKCIEYFIFLKIQNSLCFLVASSIDWGKLIISQNQYLIENIF